MVPTTSVMFIWTVIRLSSVAVLGVDHWNALPEQCKYFCRIIYVVKSQSYILSVFLSFMIKILNFFWQWASFKTEWLDEDGIACQFPGTGTWRSELSQSEVPLSHVSQGEALEPMQPPAYLLSSSVVFLKGCAQHRVLCVLSGSCLEDLVKEYPSSQS